jgi:PAS domain S-box-containing protein
MNSLKTRITLATLAIFVAGLWSLSYYASSMLRRDMERQLGEQQLSVVTAIASDINQHLADRIATLEAVATVTAPPLQQGPAAMQAFIEQRLALATMFNAGLWVTDSEGTAIASVPTSVGRVGINYRDRDFIAVPLKEGKTTIGRPVIGKKLKTAVVSIGVPIRNAQGKVIGVLSGTTNLGIPNFLDRIINRSYGKTGGYVLVAPQYRLTIAATDKRRVMQPLPEPGVNLQIDRFIQHCDGYATYRGVSGIETLTSCKRMPVSGWDVGMYQFAEEAFAPIRAMQHNMLLATLLLTLISGGITWWVLWRQLAPMTAAAKALSAMADSKQPPQALPVARHDEIGALVGGFNHLLAALDQRGAALAESEQQHRQLVQHLHAGVVVHGPDTQILLANEQASKLLGLSVDQMMGKPAIDPAWRFFREDEAVMPLEEYPVQRVIATQQPVRDLVLGINRPATEDRVWVLVNAFPEMDARGRLRQAVVTFIDITERKKAEAQLITAKTAAETASLTKSRFLAAASHDLRQPMQAIGLFQDALTRTDPNPEQERILDYLVQSTRSMGELLDALLDISKLDAGGVQVSREIIQVQSLARQIDTAFAPMATEKSLRFKLSFPFRDMAIQTDGKLLMGLLRNLIGNAIKYTGKSGVLVAIRRRGNQALIQVWDTGIGIAGEHLDAIYEDYFQIGNAERDRSKGLGLGLAIARRIATLLETDIVCRSRVGKGSVFEFRLPLASGKDKEPPGRIDSASTDTETRPAGRRIVLVEDDLMVATAMTQALESCGMTVTRYGTAEDALADSTIADADFYISDLRLPGLSGVEFLDAVQRRASKPIQAIVVTGDTAIDRIEMMRSTSWRVLFKPVELSTLLSAIGSQDAAH